MNRKNGILLESGTNEIEIMKFLVRGEYYGINVIKVREIQMSQKVKEMPRSHPAVEGFIKPRGSLITVINLEQYLYGERSEEKDRELFVVTSFNKTQVAFRVDSIEGISRISWKAIHKPDMTLGSEDSGVATGIAQCDGQLVTILDFEKILADISPETSIKVSEVDKMGDRSLSFSPIVLVEDSVLLQKTIQDALERAGFTDLRIFNDGQAAWDFLKSIKDDEMLYEKINMIVTDIEMPRMDGHHLTKLIKSDNRLKNLPVIIFSSLIDEQMRAKGDALGANAQVPKPDVTKLIEEMDKQLKIYEEKKNNGFKRHYRAEN